MEQTRTTRRRMIADSARALAGLSLASLAASCRRAAGPAGSGYDGFRIGACDWSLGKTSDPGSFEVAKRIGLDGVQISMGTVENGMHLRRPDVQKLFLEAAGQNGQQIASMCILVLNGIPYKSDACTEQWVADGIDACAAMGVKVLMLPFFGKNDLRDDAEGTAEVVRRLRLAAPKAEKTGVDIGIESMLSAERHMDIIDRVGSPAVKVYYDVGNSHKAGYDIYEEIRQLGSENICEFHAKDYNNLFGQGKVDFPRVRKAMDDAGWRGWIQIEGAKPLGMEASYRHDCEYLRGVFPPKA